MSDTVRTTCDDFLRPGRIWGKRRIELPVGSQVIFTMLVVIAKYLSLKWSIPRKWFAKYLSDQYLGSDWADCMIFDHNLTNTVSGSENTQTHRHPSHLLTTRINGRPYNLGTFGWRLTFLSSFRGSQRKTWTLGDWLDGILGVVVKNLSI